MSGSSLSRPNIYFCSGNYDFYLIQINKNVELMNPTKMSEIRRFTHVISQLLPEASFLYSTNAVFIRKSYTFFHVCTKYLKYILYISNLCLVANYRTLELLSSNCHGMRLRTRNCLTFYHSFILKNATEYSANLSFCYNCKYLILSENFVKNLHCLDKTFIVEKYKF